MPAPDFLVIGAQKSGTTWLYSCLRKHSGLYLPPKKELHYFDSAKEYLSSNKLSVESPFRRLINFSLFKNAKKDLARINNIKTLKWYLRYHLGYYNDEWYKSLFDGKSADQIAGEVTPAYSTLLRKDVEKIYSMNSNLKVIFILRNPVERDWSAFKMRIRKNNLNYEEIAEEYVYNFFNSFSSKGDYISAIERWTDFFSPAQFFIGYYDEIEKDPKKFLQRIFDFLKLNSPEDWGRFPLEKRLNKGLRIPIEKKYEIYLSQKYSSDLKVLLDITGSDYVLGWYEQVIRTLNSVNSQNEE